MRIRRHRRRQLDNKGKEDVSWESLDTCRGRSIGAVRTECEDEAATLGKDPEGAVVLLPGRVLDAGGEQTSSTGDHGALHAGIDSVHRVIVVVITVGRHFRWLKSGCGLSEWFNWQRRGCGLSD